MNPIEDAWSALKAAGRYSPVGGSKTTPTYSGGPGTAPDPRYTGRTENSSVAEAGGPSNIGPYPEPTGPAPMSPEEGAHTMQQIQSQESSPHAARWGDKRRWMRPGFGGTIRGGGPEINERGEQMPTPDEHMWSQLLSQAGHGDHTSPATY